MFVVADVCDEKVEEAPVVEVDKQTLKERQQQVEPVDLTRENEVARVEVKQQKPNVNQNPGGHAKGMGPEPSAGRAIEAVDKAVERLPPEEELGITFLSEGSYLNKAPDEPPNRGKKEAPQGHPDALTGKTFVISGVLDSMKREEMERYIKQHGGRVTSAVSGKTTFLVVGSFTGKTKYKTAKDKGIALINEDGVFSLIAATGGIPVPVPEVQEQLPCGVNQVSEDAKENNVKNDRGHDLWVEKWRPQKSADLVGNNTLVGTLRLWLQQWEGVNLHGQAPRAPPGARKDIISNMKKKAVLLSGSPGIGKTSAALIVARELGYVPIEVNASDTRSKSDSSILKGIGGKRSNSVKEMSTNTSLNFGTSKGQKVKSNVCREVDDMYLL